MEEVSHFARMYDYLDRNVIYTHHYLKDRMKCGRSQEVILAEQHLFAPHLVESHNLHKFEYKVAGGHLFRSGIGVEGNTKDHVIVYFIKNHKVYFLRVLPHSLWERLLDQKHLLEKDLAFLGS